MTAVATAIDVRRPLFSVFMYKSGNWACKLQVEGGAWTDSVCVNAHILWAHRVPSNAGFNKTQVNALNWQVSFTAYKVKNQRFQGIVYIEIHGIGSYVLKHILPVT